MKINLIEEYKDSNIREQFNIFKKNVRGFSDTNEKFNLKTGDVITFVDRYSSDVEFTSEVLGFDADGFAFVLWDCYWFGVNLEDQRRNFHPFQKSQS